MDTIIFDFSSIGAIGDFYKIAKTQLSLPEDFGNNLDALWDVITGGISLPVHIQFKNLSMSQLEQFNDVIVLLEDAADELGDSFVFEYYLNNRY